VVGIVVVGGIGVGLGIVVDECYPLVHSLVGIERLVLVVVLIFQSPFLIMLF
jgi:uncharacterized membrane protein YedE/YeeE